MKYIAYYFPHAPLPPRRIYIRPEFTNGRNTPNDRAHATRYDTYANAANSDTADHLRTNGYAVHVRLVSE